VSKWRPIDTAPKDGTKFWGSVDGDAVAMFWHPGFCQFVSRFSRMTLADGMTFEETGTSYKDHSPEIHWPKYWMPIEDPPETAP
jgi:hypothetical protein